MLALTISATAEPWERHTIDQSSKGADGVRLMDVNGDGLLDVATGWEEGGVVRAYINPGPKKSKAEWPAVTVGRVKSAEDAVFFDVDLPVSTVRQRLIYFSPGTRSVSLGPLRVLFPVYARQPHSALHPSSPIQSP